MSVVYDSKSFFKNPLIWFVRNSNLEKLGGNIRRIRLEKGIRAVDLANRCDIERSNLARIERGEANLTVLNLIKIAGGLDVPLPELLAGMPVK